MSKWYTLKQKKPNVGSMYYVYVKGSEDPQHMIYYSSHDHPEGIFMALFHPGHVCYEASKIIAWFDHPELPIAN